MTVRGPGSPELYVKLPWGGVVVGCVSLENERRRIFFNFFSGPSRTALAVWASERADQLRVEPSFEHFRALELHRTVKVERGHLRDPVHHV